VTFDAGDPAPMAGAARSVSASGEGPGGTWFRLLITSTAGTSSPGPSTATAILSLETSIPS
jgi:hypothetical protein